MTSAKSAAVKPPALGWRVLWAAVFVALVAVGTAPVFELFRSHRISPHDPQGSTNDAFAPLGVENAAEKIAACLRDLPPGEPIAIVYWKTSIVVEKAAWQIGTLTWPHPAPLIECEPGRPPDMNKLKAAGAVNTGFVLGVQPPPGAADFRSLGPLLHFYHHAPRPVK